ncbi:MAG: HAMP domain-containing histidine kinase [Desulfuromonadales bacterium]|nr:HAMP domain-containing histidine kinase [Desulfuromonadales bacterium]
MTYSEPMSTTKDQVNDKKDEINQRQDINYSVRNELHTMTRKLEEMSHKLQASEQLKSQFLSNIRNEISNPMAAVMGLAETMRVCQQDPEQTARTAAMIYNETVLLDFQLQNIYVAADLEAGEAQPNYSLVDVPSVITGCLDRFSARTTKKQLKIKAELETNLTFTTDAKMLELLVSNLLSNAIKFNREKGDITLFISTGKAGELIIKVADTGPGIDAASREVIFDRFHQLDTGTTKNHHGHGLGLSICAALAELLNGTLHVKNSAEGGCCFVLRLPYPDINVQEQAHDANVFLFDQDDALEKF